MSDLMIRTLEEGSTTVEPGAVEALASSMRGSLAHPGEEGYDEARTLWNAMIDRRPALVARCRNTSDVQAAVRFAADHGLLTAVRGGGHNIAGNAVCEGGFMIDLSLMRSIEVDAEARTVKVEPGCSLADLDAATQEFGLATPVGINSTTGIAGLTLGGGFGWLSRQYGMTVDNLLSAEVVTASGERLTASPSENSDLFWGIRGGGGNFGVVTEFEFRLHPLGPEVLSGLIVHPREGSEELMRFYREFAAGLPDETAVWIVLRDAPPLPFLPEDWHGKPVTVLAAFHGGDDREEGERALAPLREYGNPIADVVGPHPYTGWQQAFDPLLTPGMRNYWKSHDFMDVSDELIDVLLEYSDRLPSPHCEVFLGQLGAAINRVPREATAYPHRDAEYVVNLHARWETPDEDERCVRWARDFARDAAPFATGGVYVNFLTQDEGDRVGSAYAGIYERLVALKRRYDPENLFRLNQNIAP